MLAEAKKIYSISKESIEKEKEYQYVAVGIFRSYGALTPNEYKTLLNKLNIDVSNIRNDNYYFFRFVSFDHLINNVCALALKELVGYTEELIASHPKDIRLTTNVEKYKEIGCYYFDRKSPHYINAIKHPQISEFLDKHSKEDLIILAGCSIATGYYKRIYDELIEELNDEAIKDLYTFMDCLPKYILNKNQKNILSFEEGELFYEVMMPFLKYVGNKYHLSLDFNGTNYNGIQASEILSKCVQDDFKYVDDYLNTNVLSEEAYKIIKNLKRHIEGPFIIVKHLQEGSIFVDRHDNLYLVKGIKTPIEGMSGLSETPTACDTFLFQFKDSIIYSSIIFPYPIKIVGNMKKNLLELYKKSKGKIITRLS